MCRPLQAYVHATDQNYNQNSGTLKVSNLVLTRKVREPEVFNPVLKRQAEEPKASNLALKIQAEEPEI